MAIKKYDLAADALPGYTFKKVRNLLRRMGTCLCSDRWFYKEMIHHLAPEIIGETISRRHADSAALATFRKSSAEYTTLREKAQNASQILIATLFSEGLVARDGNYWRATKASITLCAQKSLKKIARERGLALAAKAVAVAAAFNAEYGPAFYIVQLRLFGSLARPECAEVGDVDISVVLAQRITDATDHLAADMARAEEICPSKLHTPYGKNGFASIREGVVRMQRLSPYMQLANDESITRLLAETGHPSEIIYTFAPPDELEES